MGREIAKKYDRFEYYYCEIQNWSRSYSFGTDNSRWPDPGRPFSDWNMVTLEGKIRHISTDVPQRRQYSYLIVEIMASQYESEDFGPERTAIGLAQAIESTLQCFTQIPIHSFISIIPSIEKSRFKEVVIRVKNFKYRRGPIDHLDLNSNRTPSEDLM